jgi:hypothetical protein
LPISTAKLGKISAPCANYHKNISVKNMFFSIIFGGYWNYILLCARFREEIMIRMNGSGH